MANHVVLYNGGRSSTEKSVKHSKPLWIKNMFCYAFWHFHLASSRKIPQTTA